MTTYKIKTGNIVEIFAEGQKVPFLRQPHYPNGDAWESKAKAEAWAKLYIASIEDKNAPFAPAGKGLAGEPKPTKEQILEFLNKEAERFGDNVPQPLLDEIARVENS